MAAEPGGELPQVASDNGGMGGQDEHGFWDTADRLEIQLEPIKLSEIICLWS
jgi:hypothetical protein